MKKDKLLLKCLLKDIFNSYSNVLWIFIVPFVTMLLIVFTKGYETTLSGLLFLPILTTCFMVIPKIIYKYKNSSSIYYNFGNKLNSWRITFLIPIVFFCLLMIWITILILLFALIFFGYNQNGFIIKNNYLANNTSQIVSELSINELFTQHKNFFSYVETFFYFGYATILGISWSFLINSFAKKISTIWAINSCLFLYNLFFIGIIIPVQTIQTNEVLFGLSFLAPFKYLSSMNYISMWSGQQDFLNVTNTSVFDFETAFIIRDRNQITQSLLLPNTINLFSGIEKLMNFTIPFILISLCINFSSMRFRWFKHQRNTILKIKNEQMVTIKYKKYSWYVYFSVLVIMMILLITGIAMLIMANHIKNYAYIIYNENIDLNITNQDYSSVTSFTDKYSPEYFNAVNANRISRITTAINTYANSHNINLDINNNEYIFKYSLGMCCVTFIIIGLSTWSGLFMKRIYFQIQSNIYSQYKKLGLNK